jgi:acyl-[acyl-carrier-protein]-phospholipid O-acyltransferase/long-chain-fatty-acid--[acyl-carrier-protein] ligase
MEGYLFHGRGFVPAGEWYDTGDVVAVDDSGYITVKSRLKRFAKISGEMVSLDQVEELAGRCFGSARGYAAVNLPDPQKGERIILVTTDNQCSLPVFREYLKNNHYSMLSSPAEIRYLAKLSLLGSGKTDYVTLKQTVGET